MCVLFSRCSASSLQAVNAADRVLGTATNEEQCWSLSPVLVWFQWESPDTPFAVSLLHSLCSVLPVVLATSVSTQFNPTGTVQA